MGYQMFIYSYMHYINKSNSSAIRNSASVGGEFPEIRKKQKSSRIAQH